MTEHRRRGPGIVLIALAAFLGAGPAAWRNRISTAS